MKYVASFGVHTVRHCSALISSEDEIDVAFGTNIVRWSIPKQKRISEIQHSHSDLVVVLASSKEKFRLSCSNRGDVILWNNDNNNWIEFDRNKVSTGKVMSAEFSSDEKFVSVCSMYDGGRLTIFEIESNHNNNNQPNFKIRKHFETTGLVEFSFWNTIENKHFLISVEDTSDSNKKESILRVWDVETKECILKQELEEIQMAAHCRELNLLAISHRGRQMKILKNNNFEVVSKFRAAGSGSMRSMLFDKHGQIWCPSDNGCLNVFDVNGMLVYSISVQESVAYYLALWNEKTVFIGTESGIIRIQDFHQHLIGIKNENENKEVGTKKSSIIENSKSNSLINFHRMTCCGVDKHKDLVACGDFSNDIFVWSENDNTKPTYKHSLHSAVRSLSFDKSGDSLIVGTIDGNVLQWFFRKHNHNQNSTLKIEKNEEIKETEKKEDESEGKEKEKDETSIEKQIEKVKMFEKDNQIREIDTVSGGVTILRWNPTSRFFAAGTTNGVIYIYDENEQGEINQVKMWVAHKPIEGEQNLSFGSIGKYAEIWSLIWSPDGKFIVTCSEDQTCIIWNVETTKPLLTLTGHTAAVTSVDWKIMSDGSEVLVSCSDDRTIRVYDVRRKDDSLKCNLREILNTKEVTEWHTLTYLSLDSRTNLLACATQNGYIHLWNLKEKKKIYGEKVHSGSIEGLCFHRFPEDPNNELYLSSCSSDCTVHVYQMSK